MAFLLGLDAKTLHTDLRSGQTIAQVATAKGINPTTLASQIVTLLDKGIDARVAAHHLSQANATTMKSNLAARVNAFLNRSWGRKLGARHAAAADQAGHHLDHGAPTSTSSPSTTAGSSTTSAPTTVPSSSGSTSTTVKH